MAINDNTSKNTLLARFLNFAFFPKPYDYEQDGLGFAISKLSEKVLPECWSYGNEETTTFPILRNYLLMTFDRLQQEDIQHKEDISWEPRIKVVENVNDTFRVSRYNKIEEKYSYYYPSQIAVFNTGLVDRLYEPIYAVFVSNPGRPQPWLFHRFISSSGSDKDHMFLAKLYGDKFPSSALYYDSTLELVYDIRKPISSYNWAHMVEKCDRFPIDFFEDNCAEELQASRFPNGQINYALLSQKIQNNHRTYRRVQNRIQDAIEHSLKRVKWNFKTAIPIYYPGGKSISLLLPLSLVNEDRIDAALVLESTEKAYIAHTILTLEMAYANARLITRPDSDWLVPNNIQFASTGVISINGEDKVNVINQGSKDFTCYTINGIGRYPKNKLAFELVKKFIERNPAYSVEQILHEWNKVKPNKVPHFIEAESQYRDRTDGYTDRVEIVRLPSGEKLYISTEGWRADNTPIFVQEVNKQNWGLIVGEYA